MVPAKELIKIGDSLDDDDIENANVENAKKPPVKNPSAKKPSRFPLIDITNSSSESTFEELTPEKFEELRDAHTEWEHYHDKVINGERGCKALVNTFLAPAKSANHCTSHVNFAMGLCPREDEFNAKGHTVGNMSVCASWRAIEVISTALGERNIAYPSGLNCILTNARRVCICTAYGNRCKIWTIAEAMKILWLIHKVLTHFKELAIPTLVFNVGGDGCAQLFKHLNESLATHAVKKCPHMSNMSFHRWNVYDNPTNQFHRVGTKVMTFRFQ